MLEIWANKDCGTIVGSATVMLLTAARQSRGCQFEIRDQRIWAGTGETHDTEKWMDNVKSYYQEKYMLNILAW